MMAEKISASPLKKQVPGRIYNLMAIVTAMLSGISAISLFVAGVGIIHFSAPSG
jgi:hypothetical protein